MLPDAGNGSDWADPRQDRGAKSWLRLAEAGEDSGGGAPWGGVCYRPFWEVAPQRTAWAGSADPGSRQSRPRWIWIRPVALGHQFFRQGSGYESEGNIRGVHGRFLGSHRRRSAQVHWFAGCGGKTLFYGDLVWNPAQSMERPERDLKSFPNLDKKSQHHYAELVAMDRSLGTLRAGLRRLGIARNTLVWFCSDNGGLAGFKPDTVGGLRGYKGSLFEGGLRVPGVIEWPDGVTKPRVTSFPAATVDIFPTLAEIAGLPTDVMLQPQDGQSLLPLFDKELGLRQKPIGFRSAGRGALIDNDFKLYTKNVGNGDFVLYHLAEDPAEKQDVKIRYPEVAQRLRKAFQDWNVTVDASVAGKDYPSGTVDSPQPPRMFWTDLDAYRPYFKVWRDRPEYKGRLRGK